MRGVIVGSVKGTKSGAYYIVDVEVEGPANLTLGNFERIKDEIITQVKERVHGVKIVRVSARTHKSNGFRSEG